MMSCQDNWIVILYNTVKNAKCWVPQKDTLKRAEDLIREYRNTMDASKVRDVLHEDYEIQREELTQEKMNLDEAFAGVDDKNIRMMFDLVDKMDFDYIMNSQSLWGCYDTVDGVRIAELHRPMNSQIVTIIRYLWNGHERMLDEQ